ncbi:MAG TPA: ClpXP protease specificity-enhancing factor SspB, partial [Vicinamibacteria bacterium]|nr:ClpXP protease specificity-enhancing factor SspB [Vicinamibacteria bacterium]
DQMTIVLQHQYWDLAVGEEAFSVTLRFGGAPERLHVPFAALVAFADPAASFGLRFEPGEEPRVEPPGTDETPEPVGATDRASEPAGANVVDIRAFRRRDD